VCERLPPGTEKLLEEVTSRDRGMGRTVEAEAAASGDMCRDLVCYSHCLDTDMNCGSLN
jgi:hypothetical protein